MLRTLLDSGAGLIVAGGMTHAATMSDCWHFQNSSQAGFIVNRVVIGGRIVGIELCGLVGRSLAAGSLRSAVGWARRHSGSRSSRSERALNEAFNHLYWLNSLHSFHIPTLFSDILIVVATTVKLGNIVNLVFLHFVCYGAKIYDYDFGRWYVFAGSLIINK